MQDQINLITITESATSKVAELMQEETRAQALRIFVQGGGCSGFQYGFAWDNDVNEDDFVVEQQSVKFVVDSMSMQYLQGATIDYKETFEGSNFVINNPNAETTCGCGSSFGV
jgi:iron-sulfur cluster insertion protein